MKGIGDRFTVGEFFLVGHGPLKELHPQQGWLSTLPGKADLIDVLRLNVVPNVGLQDLVRHAEALAFRKQVLFFEVEAVGAIKITNRPNGLGHNMERRNPGFEYISFRFRHTCFLLGIESEVEEKMCVVLAPTQGLEPVSKALKTSRIDWFRFY